MKTTAKILSINVYGLLCGDTNTRCLSLKGLKNRFASLINIPLMNKMPKMYFSNVILNVITENISDLLISTESK